MKNSFKIASVIVGAFIGAGFASGQEIMQFFVIYGKYGLIGIFLSSLTLFMFLYCCLCNVCRMGKKEFLNQLYKLKVIKIISYMFMVFLYFTMINAIGQTGYYIFGINKIVLTLVASTVCLIMFLKGSNMIVNVCQLLTPLIVVGIILFCGLSSFSVFLNETYGVFNGILYTSYNLITLTDICSNFSRIIDSKKTIVYSSLFSSLIILVLLLCMFFTLNGRIYIDKELPFMSVFKGNVMYIYFVILIMAMFTTAITNGFAVLPNNKISIVLLVFGGVVFSIIPFSFFVKYVFSIFGYLGIVVLVYNFWIFIKNEKNRENKRKLEKTKDI